MKNRQFSVPLTLSAAVIVGFGSTLASSPAQADERDLTATELSAVADELKADDNVQIVGRTDDGALYLGTTGDVAPEDVPAVEALNADRGSDVPVEHVALDAPLEALALNDVVGGAGYLEYTSDGTGYGMCSIGFSAQSPQGEPALLTAGHCVLDAETGEPIRSVPSNDEAGGGAPRQAKPLDDAPIGSWGFNQFGGPGNTVGANGDPSSTDIAVIDVENADLNLKPEVTDWTTASSDDLSLSTTDITAVGDPQEGEPVARSGRTTGLREDDSVDVAEGWARVSGTWVHGFGTEGLESLPGDSGGPIFQGETAVGIVSGGGSSNGRPFTWGTRLKDALELTDGYTVTLKN